MGVSCGPWGSSSASSAPTVAGSDGPNRHRLGKQPFKRAVTQTRRRRCYLIVGHYTVLTIGSTSLGAASGRNVLLRQHLLWLRADVSSVARINDLIARHLDRVNWHLHRMYRTRNMLAHSGDQVPYLSALTENLHTYLDTLVYAISDGFIDLARSDSMEAVLRLPAHEA